MPIDEAPGIDEEEQSSGSRPIQAVVTGTAGFVSRAPSDAFCNEVIRINRWTTFVAKFIAQNSG